MLRSVKDLERYTVSATDGEVGDVANFLLDDAKWVIRYLIAETGSYFNGRRVLISPMFFRDAEWSNRLFHLSLSKDKVKNSPDVDLDKPVSRQHERDYYRYYGYPYYWGYPGIWGMGTYPSALSGAGWSEAPAPQQNDSGDAHLRSVNEVRGYHIQGSDEAIGHVEDFIVDDESWAIRYLVIDTSNWWFGKKVLVAPQWASHISWTERQVHLDITRQEVQDSPEWHPDDAINREYEARLYDYYGHPAYWSDDGYLGTPQSHHEEIHST